MPIEASYEPEHNTVHLHWVFDQGPRAIAAMGDYLLEHGCPEDELTMMTDDEKAHRFGDTLSEHWENIVRARRRRISIEKAEEAATEDLGIR